MEESVSTVAFDCWSNDLSRMTAACRNSSFGRVAADANGKLVIPGVSDISTSCAPLFSSKMDSSRGRCCLKRGGCLKSWLRCTAWPASDNDEELEELGSGLFGESREFLSGLGGAAAENGYRSSDFGLAMLGR
jgi:hypothetical protein